MHIVRDNLPYRVMVTVHDVFKSSGVHVSVCGLVIGAKTEPKPEMLVFKFLKTVRFLVLAWICYG